MKKTTSTVGPNGSSRLRSLLAFRHQNPVARLLSMLVAFAIATLLVVGSGAAYADETDPSSAETTAAAEPSSDESPSAEETTPAEENTDSAPDTSDDNAGQDDSSSAADTSSKDSGKPQQDAAPAADTQTAAATESTISTTLSKLASPAITADVTVPCNYAGPGATTVGGFEIDGNLCLDGDPTVGTIDWDSVDFSGDDADTQVDGFDDSTSFTNGTQERDDPSTWHINGPTPNGKSDIGTAWAFSQVNGGDVYGYFAFTNTSTAGGTSQYDVEYNQNEATDNGSGVSVPVRTPGDLLFRFEGKGNASLTYADAKIYTLTSSPDWDAGSCFVSLSSNPAAGWCDLPDIPSAFHTVGSADGNFQEGSIRISAFFPAGTCSGVFGTTQIRSVTGGSFDTSAMKDYVHPLDVTTPSTCGTLTLEKKDIDTGASVGGALFQIDGDPRPGATPGDTLCIYDGTQAGLTAVLADPNDNPDAAALVAAECDDVIADGAADGTIDVGEVEPGTYTVTELLPPPGYLLDPSDNSQDVTVGEAGDPNANPTLTFENHKKWKPLDIGKTASGTNGAHYFWTINKQIAPTADGPWSDGTTPADPLVKNDDGSDTSLYYRVVVTEDHVDTSSFVVAGTIHVDNPNDAAVNATIDESLSGCSINGGGDPVNVSVPAGGADYPYTCNLGNGPVGAGTNTATITWDRSDYPQTVNDINAAGNFSDDASDGYTFTETAIDKTVTIEDDHFTFDPAWTITWGDEADGVYESDVYSVDTDTAAGTCSQVITNTATVTGDSPTPLDQDSESGKVCVGADLTASIDDSESLTRTFPWAIQKATTTPNVTVANGAAQATYNVTVTTGAGVDSNWHIGGTVTVSNPNAWEDVPLTGLSVSYSGSNDAVKSDDCVVTESLAAPIPSGGNRTFHYNCTFTTQPDYDGSVDAAVTWDAAAAFTPHGSPVAPTTTAVATAEWTVTDVDKTVTVHDDQAGGLDIVIGTLDWATVFAKDGHKTVISYSVNLTPLPAAGTCATKVNTVWIVGHNLVHLDADQNSANNVATVQVCTPAIAVLPPKPPAQPHPNVLPNTGGPDAWFLAAGLVMLLGGGTLVASDRRRKHRS